MRCAVIIKILNSFIFYFLKWKVCSSSKQIYKLCLIVFWRNIYQWYFFRFLFIERYGGIHILGVVARKKDGKDYSFYWLFKCIRCQSNILKRKKWGKQWNYCEKRPTKVKISKQNLNFPVGILSTLIFIISIKSIKIT